jgi:hypothetical protein
VPQQHPRHTVTVHRATPADGAAAAYDLAAGGSVVVVLTALFALTWCLAPRHGLLAKLVRRPGSSAPLPAGP